MDVKDLDLEHFSDRLLRWPPFPLDMWKRFKSCIDPLQKNLAEIRGRKEIFCPTLPLDSYNPACFPAASVAADYLNDICLVHQSLKSPKIYLYTREFLVYKNMKAPTSRFMVSLPCFLTSVASLIQCLNLFAFHPMIIHPGPWCVYLFCSCPEWLTSSFTVSVSCHVVFFNVLFFSVVNNSHLFYTCIFTWFWNITLNLLFIFWIKPRVSIWCWILAAFECGLCVLGLSFAVLVWGDGDLFIYEQLVIQSLCAIWCSRDHKNIDQHLWVSCIRKHFWCTSALFHKPELTLVLSAWGDK